MRKWAVILALLFAGAGEVATNDEVAWVTPDGELVIQVERDGELLYFDSFNISALYDDVAQSPRLQWANRWEFRRE